MPAGKHAVHPELREYRVGIIPNFKQKSTKKTNKKDSNAKKYSHELAQKAQTFFRPRRTLKNKFIVRRKIATKKHKSHKGKLDADFTDYIAGNW